MYVLIELFGLFFIFVLYVKVYGVVLFGVDFDDEYLVNGWCLV